MENSLESKLNLKKENKKIFDNLSYLSENSFLANSLSICYESSKEFNESLNRKRVYKEIKTPQKKETEVFKIIDKNQKGLNFQLP